MAELKIPKNKKALTIAIVLFVLIGFLSIMMAVGLNNIRQMERAKDDAMQNIVESEWNYINARINDNYSAAFTLSNSIKGDIVKEVSKVYKNNEDQLGKDLASTSTNENTPLIKILGDSIKDVYLNGIKNDNNDPFIMSRENILSDLSLNCSADKRTRTFDEEVAMHFNRKLAKEALNSIIKEEGKQVFWSYLPVDKAYPWAEEVESMQTMDMENLKELFLKYKDIRVLSSFEFISTAYIYENKDLLNNSVVDYTGSFNENAKQLFVNSGFNIVDIIESTPEDAVVIYSSEEKIEQLEENYERTVDYNYTFIFIECIAALITFIALSRLQNSVLSKE